MEANLDNGGPAFPTDDARQIGPSIWHHDGMSLRDYFAAKALQGLLTNAFNSRPPENIAIWAYRHADAMLAARKK